MKRSLKWGTLLGLTLVIACGGTNDGAAGGSGDGDGEPSGDGDGDGSTGGLSEGSGGGPTGGSESSSGGDDSVGTGGSDSSGGDSSMGKLCLPDGTGKLRLVTTGAEELDLDRGNFDIDCSGWGDLRFTTFNITFDTELGDGRRVDLRIVVEDLFTGDTGTSDANFTLSTYPSGTLDLTTWSTEDCEVEVTHHERIEEGVTNDTYKVLGQLTCTTPLESETSPDTISLEVFEFGSRVSRG